ncbi:sigma D regulator [Alteromonas sp. 009811495]|uniref:sigma D regulator n=1 Tax=Alteromonas sp. 009811495 TaxID=3002962 RepID=UPI00237D532D|nr:sigma D regulator [Alteromonas sp. 009811495]WDT85825.1 sigma D regulator [Alteromonas sp. 009811495]
MLQQLESVKSKWGGKSHVIDKWLLERQALLVSYCSLAGINQQTECLPDADKISDFCSALLDYLSAGHFEIFELLVENDEKGQQLKEDLYPQLTKTTDAALSFNDKFAEAVSAEQASGFDVALATLGETLEERFALEDELIAHVHTHKA